MTPALAAAILLLGQAPAVAPSAPAAAPATNAPAADDAALDLDQLRQMYRDTCEAREFGAYDDMCDQLRLQVRAAERRAAQEARGRPAAASASPKPTPTPP